MSSIASLVKTYDTQGLTDAGCCWCDRYIEMVTANADVTGPFETTEFEYSRNSMAGSFDFRALEVRLVKIKEALLEEHSGWIRQGEAATAKGAHSYDCQQIQMALQVAVDESELVSHF